MILIQFSPYKNINNQFHLHSRRRFLYLYQENVQDGLLLILSSVNKLYFSCNIVDIFGCDSLQELLSFIFSHSFWPQSKKYFDLFHGVDQQTVFFF